MAHYDPPLLVKNGSIQQADIDDNVAANVIHGQCKNVSGGSLPKGTPVYQVGSAGFTITVDAADASDADKMPAIGVLGETLADEAEGQMLFLGDIHGVDTSAFSEADQIYVAVGGGYTNVKPTSPNLAQFLGIVTRVDATNGGGQILGTGQIEQAGGGAVTQAATAPSTPSAGDLWFDTVSGETFIYYNDGVTSQWVSETVENKTTVLYVGGATGTTSATVPTHEVGDLLLAYAYRDGSTTAPSLPSGWTNIANANGANSNSARLAYKIATTTSETATGFTSATSLILHVYRNVDQSSPIGGNNFDTGSSTTISYPALTMSVSNGTSLVAGFSGHRSTNTAIETAPSGMVNRTSVSDATDQAAGFDTNLGVTSWSAQTASVGGSSSGWFARTVEIKQKTAAIVFPSSPTLWQTFKNYIWDGVKWKLNYLIPETSLATTAEAIAGNNDVNYITPLKMREGFNASGTAPVYAARAWVNFDGTGTVAIRASGNVSSITDNGTGDYTVNFTTAMPDANYALLGAYRGDNSLPSRGTTSVQIKGETTPTSSAVTIVTAFGSTSASNGAVEDSPIVNVAIFR